MKTKFLETIKILDGKIYNLFYHQQRYERVLTSLGVQPSKDLSTCIQPPLRGLYRCRLVYDCEQIIEVTYHLYEKRNIQALKIVYDDSLEYKNKYENREVLNTLFTKKELCDDILIVKNGLVTDTSTANIAFYDGKNWLTPKKPLLEGTTRQRFLYDSRIIESDIPVNDLPKYIKIALLNAMIDFDIIANIRYQY